MSTPFTKTSRRAIASLLATAVICLSACSSATVQNLVKQQEDYNRAKCQEFGLAPGSDAYVKCISQGAAAYAQSVQNSNPQPPAVTPVLPFWPVIPPQNNACAASASTPKGGCQGCSVSCGTQQASCTPGQEWLGGSYTCMSPAVCVCR